MAEGVKDVIKPKRVQHCLNILYNGDTFYDIFTDECSVKIEWYTRRSFYKVCLKRSIEEVAVFCPHKVPHRSSFHVCVLKNLFFFTFLICYRTASVPFPFCIRSVPVPFPFLYPFCICSRSSSLLSFF